jgi:hypothetical protein
MIVASDFVRVGVNVNEALPRSGDVEQSIALRGSLGHATADEHHDIGALDARSELRIG